MNEITLRELDSLEVHVLVDNSTDSLSTVPQDVVHEWGHLMGSAGFVLSGEAICCSAFGLSLLITGKMGETSHTLLFDAGPEAATFGRNCERLGLDLGIVDAVVLSHGHWDHAGGLAEAVSRISDAKRGLAVECHVNPGMFVTRALQTPDGAYVPFKDIPDVETLAEAGATVVNSPEPRLLLDDFFHLSGEIPRVTSFEQGLLSHRKRSADGSTWEPDPLLLDERYVAARVKGKGIVLFTACSHAGVINILRDARGKFRGVPLFGLMGGFHLSGKGPEAAIPQTVEQLKSFGLKRVMPGHCTGWRAISALSASLDPEALVPLAVGRKFRF